MILFLEDYKKYPNAIIDTTTKNVSFTRLAGLYKKMGIENHAFPLVLHNPLLVGVDPHDPGLTREEQAMVIVEISENPWYFFREVARAPSVAGGVSFPFKANRGNIALIWLFFNHITSYLIQPRQTGKSFTTNMLMRLLLNFHCIDTEHNLLTKDNKLRVRTVEAIKDMEKELPPYLRMTTKKDVNNMETITVDIMGNKYNTHLGQSSAKAAGNVGRGLTSPIFHIDEIAFIYNIKTILPAALAAGGAARDIAEEVGNPYGTIITTTAGDPDTKSGAFAYELYQDGLAWSERFLDAKDQKELKNIVSKGSKNGRELVILEFFHRQLGYTDEWLKQKMAEAFSQGSDAERDYLLNWVTDSGKNPLDKDLLRVIKESVINEPYLDISDLGYVTRWYIPEYKIKDYKNRVLVMGLDTSNASGGDDIAMVIRDVVTGEVICAGDYNETNTITFSNWIAEWLRDFKNLTLVIENKSTGTSIIDNLFLILPEYDINPFLRLFNWVINDLEMYDKYKDLVTGHVKHIDQAIFTKFKKAFGYTTTGTGRQSRSVLFGNVLKSSVKYTGNTVRDNKLSNQIHGLVIKNGRIDHGEGGHDDMLIGWLLSYWFLLHGKHLGLYGIDGDRVLSSIIANTLVSKDDKDNVELLNHQAEQRLLKSKIEYLLEALKEEQNTHIAAKIINKINYLKRNIDTKYIQSFNINSLLEGITREKEAKSKKYYDFR